MSTISVQCNVQRSVCRAYVARLRLASSDLCLVGLFCLHIRERERESHLADDDEFALIVWSVNVGV
jgi:hypothetical protein